MPIYSCGAPDDLKIMMKHRFRHHKMCAGDLNMRSSARFIPE